MSLMPPTDGGDRLRRADRRRRPSGGPSAKCEGGDHRYDSSRGEQPCRPQGASDSLGLAGRGMDDTKSKVRRRPTIGLRQVQQSPCLEMPIAQRRARAALRQVRRDHLVRFRPQLAVHVGRHDRGHITTAFAVLECEPIQLYRGTSRVVKSVPGRRSGQAK